ncbi:MAG: SDR family oxidoreductase [Betaproteobacteria bacterium]|nr:SDR family oxidoreductase [Betaproteobacteria bacterium]
METGLKGKTVLITGASRNMGRHAALAYAREGANLAICTSTKMAELRQVADELRALGENVVAEKCDVGDAAAVGRFVKTVCGELGSIDVVLNNAVYRAEGNFLEQSDEAWMRNVEVNIHGPRNICRAVLPAMMDKKWGRIINFSGIAPFLGIGAAKAMAKTGIIGFTRGIAREFAEHNITANCIGPGTIEVERDAFQMNKELRPMQPIRRLGKPQEVVSLMVYLASEDASFITGQCYLVNGGMYML